MSDSDKETGSSGEPSELGAISESKRRAGHALLTGTILADQEEDELPHETPAVGITFGDYHLERILGRGGFGEVYLAQHAGIHRRVALKRMRAGELATDREIEHFLQGADAAAMLEHPNIVPVFHVGRSASLPFFTMRYVEGENLAQALARGKPPLERAIRWMIQLTRAVQHAHDRGVIHLDLKPANILLDEANTPYVTDFGLARRLAPAGESQSALGGGAPYYMAPEQLAGEPNELTVRSDIYALGVLFHELLTGATPYATLTLDAWKAALVSAPPTPSARELAPALDPDLATICALAAAKRPADRYQSALALAEDLEHFERGEREQLSFRASAPWARVRRWLRQRRFGLGMALWTLAFFTVFALRWRGAYRGEQESLARQQQEDAAMASVQAVAFRFQLLEYAHCVARLARQPDVVALLESEVVENPSAALIARASGFDSMFVMAPDGRQRARTTRMSEDYMQRSFAFRDYFRGARQLAATECGAASTALDEPQRTAYLARAHVSESDGHFEFAIAAPVCDARGWIGVLGATIESKKGFGGVRLSDGHPGRFAALLGPRDVERKDRGGPPPDGLTFIVHPGLTAGREYQLEHPDPASVRAALGLPAPSGSFRYVEPFKSLDYTDPVPIHGFWGPWSAAFAPVDASGFVVVVQSPRPPARSFIALCASFGPELAVFGVGLALLSAFRARRKLA